MRYEVRVIDDVGPGRCIGRYGDERDARRAAAEVANQYPWGVCIYDARADQYRWGVCIYDARADLYDCDGE